MNMLLAIALEQSLPVYIPILSPYSSTVMLGSTPIGMYKKLVEFCKAGQLSFKHVVTFNMDEYVGIPRDHPESYHSFMFKHLFNHIDIDPANVHILDGNAPDLVKECDQFEEKMKAVGGVELFIGGMQQWFVACQAHFTLYCVCIHLYTVVCVCTHLYTVVCVCMLVCHGLVNVRARVCMYPFVLACNSIGIRYVRVCCYCVCGCTSRTVVSQSRWFSV